MANLDAKSGFNPIGKMGSGPPQKMNDYSAVAGYTTCLLYTSPSPRDRG